MPKQKKMVTKCLLLKTADDRCFFTEEKNFPLLMEFGRTFDAELSVVKTKQEVEALELKDLAKSICTAVSTEFPEYDVLEIKLPKAAKSLARNEKIKKTTEISEFIAKKFMDGETVSVSDLEEKFMELSKSTLSNYITRVRRDLQAKGHHITRDKPGCYRLANNLKPD